jgi:hypothetical protein
LDIRQARDEVTFKVGRNVLLLQHLERLLKLITPTLSLSGRSVDELEKCFADAKSRASKSTLGMTAGQLLKGDYAVSPPDDNISVTYGMELEPETRELIETVIRERNHLIHHFLDDADFDSVDYWKAAADDLDHQRQQIHQFISMLKTFHAAISVAVNSEEFQCVFSGPDRQDSGSSRQ